MEIYLVGGAVRDQLLGRSVKDRDWVVTQANPEALLALGYRPVGKDFPVFLHPHTGEEYALARTERKQGRGYKGFAFDYQTTITLEQDLIRRDFTINAMAKDSQDRVIDPFGGQQAIKHRWIQHVSPAFSEDPLRVLRGARFAASLHTLGFKIHPDTLALMHNISESGELADLAPERIWLELTKVFEQPNVAVFFETLEACQALNRLFPELIAPSDLARACAKLTMEPSIDADLLYTAVLSIPLSEQQIQQLWQRLKAPKRIIEMSLLVKRILLWWAETGPSLESLHPEQLLEVLRHADALRKPVRFRHALLLLRDLGHQLGSHELGHLDEDLPQSLHLDALKLHLTEKYYSLLTKALDTCLSLDPQSLPIAGLSGPKIQQIIHAERLKRLGRLTTTQSK